MKWVDDIFSFVWGLYEWFYSLYYESRDIPIVGPVISRIFLAISNIIFDLLTPIAHFGDWVDDVADRLLKILSWDTIKSLIKVWLSGIETIITWFPDWAKHIRQVISDWWSSVSSTVQGWISSAVQVVKDLITQVVKDLATLQSAWDSVKGKIPSIDAVISWWSNVTANILLIVNSWWGERLREVDTLINSKLKTWFPFYDDLVKLWSTITTFFTNPLDWLLDRFTDWFLGAE